jgi:hypothetical protein
VGRSRAAAECARGRACLLHTRTAASAPPGRPATHEAPPAALPAAAPWPPCHAAVEDVKIALLSCLASWLPQLGAGAPLPAPLVPQLAACLSEPKDGLRRATLRAAGAALQRRPELAAGLGALAVPLGKLVAEGCAKAVARGDGVVALLLAAQVAAADGSAGVCCGCGGGAAVVAVMVGLRASWRRRTSPASSPSRGREEPPPASRGTGCVHPASLGGMLEATLVSGMLVCCLACTRITARKADCCWPCQPQMPRWTRPACGADPSAPTPRC